MRRKHLILASCIISALLLTFTFHVSADENVAVDAGASSNSAPLLDSYFWDNYTLLPYIESDGNQYIDTDVYLNGNSVVNIVFTPMNTDGYFHNLFGVKNDDDTRYLLQYRYDTDQLYFLYANNSRFNNFALNKFNIYDCLCSNDLVINGNELITYNSSEFTSDYKCYIFNRSSANGTDQSSAARLYKFSIYDTSLSDPNDEDSEEVGYVRYYYPARSKSSDVIGLYDAVTKTFVTTSTQNPFINPNGSDASMGISANVVTFISSGLGWIGDILGFAIQEPMILMFMAIGICGVAFRWARRVVHF